MYEQKIKEIEAMIVRTEQAIKTFNEGIKQLKETFDKMGVILDNVEEECGQ